ncbi:MAG: ABC transporter ATP-binding protein [Spirochaetaceae bacterium]|nr:ABC transporter ATP-binding protein [Spirochaetaceae bacterium]MCF7948362.1 ABC transporter ATP-binding protein [Spirochaetia bacterium]MCF7950827.1 ABC transporter ATP-binding protein [Spirochaetaceae bacterium]
MSKLLQVNDLKIEFQTDRGAVVAVDGIDFSLEKGETLGLVGESGAGKSVTSLAVMGLLPKYASVTGSVNYQDKNLLTFTEHQLQRIRGDRISMIFQEPMTSLNPVFTIQDQLSETIELHQGGNRAEILEKTVDSLDLVGIPNARRIMRQYPHQLSGGMRQRIMIAMALACNPDILIADEPTTALDVTIQAQILLLMRNLQERLDTGVLLITHDLGVVAQVAHKVGVMYAGQIVEFSSMDELFRRPKHPYTRGLLATIPNIDIKQAKLPIIEGTMPDLSTLPAACRFHPRCPECREICRTKEPPAYKVGESMVRCWNFEKEGAVTDE